MKRNILTHGAFVLCCIVMTVMLAIAVGWIPRTIWGWHFRNVNFVAIYFVAAFGIAMFIGRRFRVAGR